MCLRDHPNTSEWRRNALGRVLWLFFHGWMVPLLNPSSSISTLIIVTSKCPVRWSGQRAVCQMRRDGEMNCHPVYFGIDKKEENSTIKGFELGWRSSIGRAAVL